MNGDIDVSNRSSSPLKRRASSMEPEEDDKTKGVAESQNSGSFPRAMSIDPPDYRTAAEADQANSKSVPLVVIPDSNLDTRVLAAFP